VVIFYTISVPADLKIILDTPCSSPRKPPDTKTAPGRNLKNFFEKGIDFIEKWVYNVKPYEIVALGGVINAQHQVL
jgi:hypothetical protein